MKIFLYNQTIDFSLRDSIFSQLLEIEFISAPISKKKKNLSFTFQRLDDLRIKMRKDVARNKGPITRRVPRLLNFYVIKNAACRCLPRFKT